MKLTIITFGKIKNYGVMLLIDHYSRLVNKYFVLNIITLKDPGEKKVQYKDCSSRLGDINIFLTETGKLFRSKEFSKYIETKKNITSQLVFVIANAYGFSEDIYKYSDLKFSLSQMTLPHELTQVILLEQLFRAGSIAAGSKYHK